MSSRALIEAKAIRSVLRAGLVRPVAPKPMAAALRAVRELGPVGGGLTVAAAMHGERTAVVDDAGRFSFIDLDRRSNALARRLSQLGLGDGGSVGILCRNHSGALIAAFAAAKAGSRAVFLNAAHSAPQVADIAAREDLAGFVIDDDLRPLIEDVSVPGAILTCWQDGLAPLEVALDGVDTGSVAAPSRRGQLVLLTSGTTGIPKGAPREQPRSLLIPGALLERIPFRSRGTVVVPAPLFHGTGFTLATLNLSLGSTLVLRRKFSPEQFLVDLEREQATGAVVVPVMLQRLLALGEQRIEEADLSRLRVVFCAGSQLTGTLGTAAMDALGDVLYNLYGSTEASYATIATPEDMRAAPGCAGKPGLGARVELLDDGGRPVPPGSTGRIFVGNTSSFGGYTDGSNKEVIRGLMSTGDIGRFDAGGRLFVEGRDDEMIVSGGENVFPHEVEDVLEGHPAVADAAVVGDADAEFGQRLVAFVVRAPETEVDEDTLKALVRDRLARYKTPRDIHFIDELPRNGAGKVVKPELKKRLADAAGPTSQER